ncbi:hypothetical protein UFOVP181_432 [uncultured Caudovirales phage]|uniref:Uncharacterized protein n=1 Tax=uncultured Caudovirales phage TaxID=2100421 RepID=A0A6J7WJI1_9CAUD|nr:hypothetical protein UFOVP181_432 [uncultured Caudovirales phage]
MYSRAQLVDSLPKGVPSVVRRVQVQCLSAGFGSRHNIRFAPGVLGFFLGDRLEPDEPVEADEPDDLFRGVGYTY